jgi:hypothetical protein
MAPANRTWWWYFGQTAEQVSQLLIQNKAMLTDISAYVDVDHRLKFAVIMTPANQGWWWYFGQTAEQVGQLLAENKARLTDISAYVDLDHTRKFAVIMAPANQEWWWYFGQTGEEVNQLLTKNNAMLTDINAYVDVYSAETTLDRGNTKVSKEENWTKAMFAVIMTPANQTWWWYYGVTASELGEYLTKNKARLTAVSPFVLSP